MNPTCFKRDIHSTAYNSSEQRADERTGDNEHVGVALMENNFKANNRIHTQGLRSKEIQYAVKFTALSWH